MTVKEFKLLTGITNIKFYDLNGKDISNKSESELNNLKVIGSGFLTNSVVTVDVDYID